MEFAAFGLFLAFWLALMLATFGGMAVRLAAIISVARVPAESFGPWWDNTKTAWFIAAPPT